MFFVNTEHLTKSSNKQLVKDNLKKKGEIGSLIYMSEHQVARL